MVSPRPPRSTLPPGPRAPAAIQTARWLTHPIELMESCARRYGDAFSLSFLGFERPMVLLSDPDAIRTLYGEAEHGLPPGRTIALRPIMGDRSILLLEGREHLQRRRAMLPPFHGERLRAYEDQIAAIAADEIERWPLREPFALHPRMRAITFELILRVVFGVTDPGRLERLRVLLPRLLDGTASPLMSFKVLAARRLGLADPLARFVELHHEIDAVLLADIAARRAADAEAAQAGAQPDRGDVLSLLLAARFEDGSAMSDRELRDQLVTLLLAGHETTATALAWTFDLLLHAPVALARLRAELREGGDAYLRAVVAESLRLRPVLPLAGRRLAHELHADGYTLPAGTDVTPAIWLTHTRADLYPRPQEFRPERFLERPPSTYAWIPFGGGVRRCLGAAFAELEMRIVIAAVLERLDLAPASPLPERVARRNITFAPRHGTVVRALRRPAPVADAVGA
jgi:cytochrome P450 family 135